MNDDAELLRRYSEDHAEEAFAELVKRRLGLVYAQALRRVGGDAHLAEDVAQRVFCDLARKAPSLAGRPALSGWLYVSTHLAAAAVVRKERRRKTREAYALTMEKILDAPASGTEPDWDRLRPLLDQLILELKEIDRDAVVLRFFEKRPFAEIASALRLTEEAARKRVDRAVEKLRARLAARGVTSSATALTFVLAEQVAASVPAALAAQITGAALTGVATAGAGTSLLASLFTAVASGTAALVALLLAGAGLVTWQHRTNAELRAQLGGWGSRRAEINALQSENRRLAQRVGEVESLRDAATAPVEPPETVAAKPLAPPVTVTVTSRGTIRWEGEPVTLQNFIQRLAALKNGHPEQEPQLTVHGDAGVAFGPTAYVVEETSKAGIAQIAVDSPAVPDPSDNWITPASPPLGPTETPPPMIPDPAAGTGP